MRRWHAAFIWIALCFLGVVVAGGALLTSWDSIRVVPIVRAQESPTGQSKYVEREPFVPEESGPHPCDDPDFPCEAIRVVRVTVNGQVVTPGPYYRSKAPSGLPFLAGEDWLKGLAFTIKNRTARKFVRVTMVVGFPDTEWVDGTGMLHRIGQNIEFGRLPEINQYTKDGVKVDYRASIQPIAFMPGQEITISFAPYADDMRKRIEEVQPFNTIRRCFILLQTAYFENGTEWMLVEYKIADAGHPGSYRNVEPSDLHSLVP